MANLGNVGRLAQEQPKRIVLDVFASKNATLNPIYAFGDQPRDTQSVLPQDWKTFSGTVTDSLNQPAQRTIHVIRRQDGYLLGKTTSNPTTGAYSIAVPAASEVQIVCQDDDAGTIQNDMIHRVLPD